MVKSHNHRIIPWKFHPRWKKISHKSHENFIQDGKKTPIRWENMSEVSSSWRIIPQTPIGQILGKMILHDPLTGEGIFGVGQFSFSPVVGSSHEYILGESHFYGGTQQWMVYFTCQPKLDDTCWFIPRIVESWLSSPARYLRGRLCPHKNPIEITTDHPQPPSVGWTTKRFFTIRE